jgi:hypothetical protein
MMTLRISLAGAAFALALSIAIWPTVGHAYTPDEDEACRGDAFRLCSFEIPDVDRITACMERKKSQLSPACRRFFGPTQSAAVGKPVNIKPTRKSKSKKVARRNAT